MPLSFILKKKKHLTKTNVKTLSYGRIITFSNKDKLSN